MAKRKKERKRKEEGTQNKSGWERKEKAGGTTYYEWESIREKELQKLSRVLKRIMESGKKTLNCIKPNWAKTNLWEENGKDSLKIKNCFKLLTLLDFFEREPKFRQKIYFHSDLVAFISFLKYVCSTLLTEYGYMLLKLTVVLHTLLRRDFW
jgi:hypothetical protein